jgi:hypothetical protein
VAIKLSFILFLAVSDVNEKFSGLTMEDMNSATKDLPEVRREMCRLIDEDTIIIGHGYVFDFCQRQDGAN